MTFRWQPGKRLRYLLCGAVLVAGILLGTPSRSTAQSTCATRGQNWYGLANAPVGAGTADGAYIRELMPQSYYAGTDATSDEAVWVVNNTWLYNNYQGNYSENGGWELGWFMGVWPYSTSYQYYYNPHGYDTIFNGAFGSILNVSDLPTNGDSVEYLVSWVDTTCPYNEIVDLYTNTIYYQTAGCYTSSSIEVPTPRDNQSQGEIASKVSGDPEGSWMGGNSGSGVTSHADYQAISDHNFYPWGSYSMCDNSPYWIENSSEGSNAWKNGGS
jgi:hypothetical protein